MRRLILMRHAKSSWDHPELSDHDRPLNGRGRRSAELMGAWLDENGYRPDAAFVSTAERTRETWARLAPVHEGCEATASSTLYLATSETILRALHDAPEVPCLLILGHQPGIGVFAERALAAPPRDPAFEKFPTAAVAVIDFPVARWKDVQLGTGRLVDFATPKALTHG
ncbi:SixA phosphatase family protein [Parvularcula lutaonensis]|uniref:SixA phosphatase family protein n=1 Tax=Parvularcula lutaonensis TaxID=491923 RepID=A0ABV7MBR2_9PROT|nr:histidine phosphatase family protein [Parvularcula lutaonensis]GGY47733.1 phosphoglycerate mutase [Parvularcula lutaonensis]